MAPLVPVPPAAKRIGPLQAPQRPKCPQMRIPAPDGLLSGSVAVSDDEMKTIAAQSPPRKPDLVQVYLRLAAKLRLRHRIRIVSVVHALAYGFPAYRLLA